MVNQVIIFISSFFILQSLPTAHEFHVSKCLVEYKSEAAEIQVSLNIFIDDLETALLDKGIEKLYIGTEKESAASDIHIQKYLNQVFVLGINDIDNVEMNFIGKEVSEDLTSIWCYMSVSIKEPIRTLYIKNSVLLDTFDDQKNITSIVGPAKKKSSFMSNRGDDEKKISY